LLDPLIERRTVAGGEVLYPERPELLAAFDLPVKRVGVALELEPAFVLATCFTPADPPAISAAGSLDTHDAVLLP
jgi:hypothetical protein